MGTIHTSEHRSRLDVNQRPNPCRGATCFGTNRLSPLVHGETLGMRKHGGFRPGDRSPFPQTWPEIGLCARMGANVSDWGFGVARYLTASRMRLEHSFQPLMLSSDRKSWISPKLWPNSMASAPASTRPFSSSADSLAAPNGAADHRNGWTGLPHSLTPGPDAAACLKPRAKPNPSA